MVMPTSGGVGKDGSNTPRGGEEAGQGATMRRRIPQLCMRRGRLKNNRVFYISFTNCRIF
jgi:hypothetical protein